MSERGKKDSVHAVHYVSRLFTLIPFYAMLVILLTDSRKKLCVASHIPISVFTQHNSNSTLTLISSTFLLSFFFFLQYKSYKIPCGPGRSCSLSFTDVMGFEQNEGNGVSVTDLILALKGHIKEGYMVCSFKFSVFCVKCFSFSPWCL